MFFELSNGVLINLDYVVVIDGRNIQLQGPVEVLAPVGDIDKIRSEVQSYNIVKARAAGALQKAAGREAADVKGT